MNHPPLAVTQMGTIFVQLQPEAAGVTAEVFIRGHADLRTGTRASIVTRAAGQTFTDDPATSLAKDGNYSFARTFTVPPNSGLHLTVLLILDRDIVEGELPGSSLTVDSVDFSFKPVASAPGKKRKVTPPGRLLLTKRAGLLESGPVIPPIPASRLYSSCWTSYGPVHYENTPLLAP